MPNILNVALYRALLALNIAQMLTATFNSSGDVSFTSHFTWFAFAEECQYTDFADSFMVALVSVLRL